ncbi:lysozyme C-2-like [Heptranchias perlo]|uniref:lysozyme C-2-like n=1 Tax=Heptranchias perlo TaxID=212740 RepID=UPI003559733F
MKILLVLNLLLVATSAKIFQRCELARILKAHGLDGFHGYSLANWLCVAYGESVFDTQAIKHYRNDGIMISTNYGIFQINSRLWCNDDMTEFSKNLCGINCHSLLDDDITDDIQCAKSVVVTQLGMEIWPGWKRKCMGQQVDRLLFRCEI